MTVRSREAGFTLIELLVAMAVFAIAAMALLRLNSFAVMSTADLDGRAMAGLVVRNAAVLALTDPGPVIRGASSTVVVNGGRRFTVRRLAAPTDDQRLLQIDIVAEEQGTGARAATTVIKRVS